MADVFISYARKDQEFVRRLHDALAERGKQAWVDWDDIPPTAQWFEEIKDGVSGADAFLFVLSPDSLASKVCGNELAYALEQNKRIVPVLLREPDGTPVPDEVASANWIFFTDSGQFESALDTLVRALDTDLHRVRFHTRLLVRAGEWDEHERPASRLLRGDDLREAEQFLSQPDVQPEPTALQREYVAAGRRAAGRRQRALLAGVSAALVVAIGLGILALIQRALAVDRQKAALSRALTADALANLNTDPELSVLLAAEAVRRHSTPEADLALRQALGADQLQATLGHTAGTVGVARYSSNGLTLVTSGSDGSARLWDGASGRLLHVLRGHQGPILDAGFDASGSRVVTAGADATVRVWSAATGQPAAPSFRLPMPATQAALTPNDRTLVTAGGDGALRVWDLATRRLQATLGSPGQGHFERFALSADGRLVAAGGTGLDRSLAETGVLRIWDLRTGHARTLRSRRGALGDARTAMRRLHPNTPPPTLPHLPVPAITAVAFSPDRRLVAAGDNMGTGMIYTTGGRLVAKLHGDPGVTGPDYDAFDDVRDVAFSRDGRYVATAGARGAARIWEASTGHLAATLRTGAPVQSVRFSPDGSLLVTGSEDGRARVWQLSHYVLATVLAGHTNPVRLSDFNPSPASQTGPQVVTAAPGDRSARLWRALPGRRLGQVDVVDQTGAPQLNAFDAVAGGSEVLTVAQDGMAALWRTSGGRLVTQRSLGSGLLSEHVSPDGAYSALSICTAGAQTACRLGTSKQVANQVIAIDNRTLGAKRLVRMQTAAGGPVHYTPTVGISSAGGRVIAGSPSGSAIVWNGMTGAVVAKLPAPPGTAGTPTMATQLSADGRRALIAASANSNVATVWDVALQRRLAVVNLPAGQPLNPALLSPDGTRLATVGFRSQGAGEPAMWDAGTGRELYPLRTRFGGVAVANFDRSGRWLVAGGDDGSVTIWNVATGHSRLLVTLPDFTIKDAEVSADDRLVVVSTADGTAHLYDLRTGTAVATLMAESARPLVQAQFTDPLQPVITVDQQYVLRFYACDVCGSSDDVLAAARRLVTRGLTPAERTRYLGGG